MSLPFRFQRWRECRFTSRSELGPKVLGSTLLARKRCPQARSASVIQFSYTRPVADAAHTIPKPQRSVRSPVVLPRIWKLPGKALHRSVNNSNGKREGALRQRLSTGDPQGRRGPCVPRVRYVGSRSDPAESTSASFFPSVSSISGAVPNSEAQGQESSTCS